MRGLILAILLKASAVGAQDGDVVPPSIPFRVVEDFFEIPDTMWLAEAVGVALNAKGFDPCPRLPGREDPLSRPGIQLPLRQSRSRVARP